MYKLPLLCFSAVLVLTSSQTYAFSVTDRWTGDLNIITSSGAISGEDPGFFEIVESYGENNLITYPAASGNAIANIGGEPGCAGSGTCWFDKVITVNPGDLTGIPLQLHFKITNNTPYTWTDYHFEFMTSDFNAVAAQQMESIGTPGGIQLDTMPADWVAELGDLEMVWLSDFMLSPGNDITIEFGFQGIFTETTTFGVRQIATTAVPLPPAIWLFGTGLLGLIGIARRKKTS